MTAESTIQVLGVDPAGTEAWYRTVWLPAWNSHDVETVLATLTADSVFQDTGWRRAFVGPQQWRIPIGDLWTAFPDLEFALVEPPMLSVGTPRAAFHYRGTGTMTGPLGRHGATGKALDFEAIEVLSFRGELVESWWGVADMADHYRQIGIHA